jgi:spore coat assembly protein
MEKFNVGDLVVRKSYGCDILFKIVDIICKNNGRIAVLKGVEYRLQADAPESDLVLKPELKV